MIHPGNISIKQFDYNLPDHRIAQYPLEKRDESKLLVYKGGEISDSVFKKIDTFLEPGTLLVFNNTRVIRARLKFSVNGKHIEIFCLEPAHGILSQHEGMVSKGTVRWNCLVGNLRRWKGEVMVLAKNDTRLEARVLSRKASYTEIDFKWHPAGLTFAEVLARCGEMPIPPYLKRASDASDEKRYQTVYAVTEGSVAAPTAGLHFTDDVLRRLGEKNIKKAMVTLHVGAGTFMPVKGDTLSDHTMHAEWLDTDEKTITRLISCAGKMIVAVGTTSLRTIESLYWMGVKVLVNPHIHASDLPVKQWEAYGLMQYEIPAEQALESLLKWMRNNGKKRITCQTGILIAPPYRLKLATGIITNFHQPQSTLLFLVSAIVGDKWAQIYEHALTHDYRFLSYGDSSLLLK
jgi:S-adenosylmethionine:tRNA ribosyltransferase-isomerase